MVTQYDYDRDEAGGGRDCYYRSTETLTALGNNQFQQTDSVENSSDTFTAIRQGSSLTVSYTDEDDINGNGSTDDLITRTYPELNNIDPANLEIRDQAPTMSSIPVLSTAGLTIGVFTHQHLLL